LDIKLHRTLVEYPFFSDHAPILLQMEDSITHRNYPFKVHDKWLLEKDFNDLVRNLWTDQKFLQENNSQKRFLWKLKELKESTKRWVKEKKIQDFAKLIDLERNIIQILHRKEGARVSREIEANLIYLESERNKLLKEQEDVWRSK
jgi:hypothetical protein